MIAGSAKSYKTWTSLELAFSVASGLPFLSQFPVEQPGRALVYLAEDALPLVRSRIESLCAHHHFDIRQLDLYVITEPVVRLDLADHQEKLRQTVVNLKPRLLILDPLVRLHRLDENNATEMSGLLGYLRALQRSQDVAIILVHHVSKRSRAQQGQAMRGTSDLHAWTDCAVVVDPQLLPVKSARSYEGTACCLDRGGGLMMRRAIGVVKSLSVGESAFSSNCFHRSRIAR
jgi:RecA-family ATPase